MRGAFGAARRGWWCAIVVGAAVHGSSCASASPGNPDEVVPLPDRVPNEGGDAALDAAPADGGAPACDPAKPFGAATLLGGAWDKALPYSTPRLSADELTIYFTLRLEAGADSQLGRATRVVKEAPFGPPAIMLAQSSTSADNDPSVSADHLSLWFRSDRGGNADLWTATRASTAVDFGAPALVPNVNGPATEAHAYYRQSAGELWFVSNRGGAMVGFDIYVAKRASADGGDGGDGGGFGAPALVPALESTADDFEPQPSEDGLRILFASSRDGGKGGLDLWIAQRASTAQAFAAPSPITELNTASGEQAGWLSADGCRIFFSSDRDGTSALYTATRPP